MTKAIIYYKSSKLKEKLKQILGGMERPTLHLELIAKDFTLFKQFLDIVKDYNKSVAIVINKEITSSKLLYELSFDGESYADSSEIEFKKVLRIMKRKDPSINFKLLRGYEVIKEAA